MRQYPNRMLSAINDLMLDMLEKIIKIEDVGKKTVLPKLRINESIGRGRGENAELHKKIEMLLQEGKSYTTIMHLITCSRGTIAKVATRLKSLK